MENCEYKINKGINQSIEFKGLKAQYIWILGGGIVVLLILFAVMYLVGLPSLVCVGAIMCMGTLLVVQVYKMSNRYGEFGLMKKLARKQVPTAIRSRSRKVFIDLDKKR